MLRQAVKLVVGPESEWFWTMLQFIVFAISVFFIYRQIRLQSHSNMLHAIFALANHWEAERMVEARFKLCQDYRPKEERLALNQAEGKVAAFFEEVGVYLRKGAFTPDVIWENYSYYIEHYWPMLEPKIREFRRLERDDTWFDNFERLYRDMQRISKRKGVRVVERTGDDLVKFTTGELRSLEGQAGHQN